MTTAVLWFRRDLRLGDHPALHAALTAADGVVPVFVPDPRLLVAGAARVARLHASIAALHEATEGALVVRTGDPTEVVPALADEVAASEVHVSRESTPFGRRRDARVAERLAASGRRLVGTGTPYAVEPGLLRTAAGTPYQVFTPFSRAWRDRAGPDPEPYPDSVAWRRGVAGEPWRTPLQHHRVAAGEEAALARWRAFLDDGLAAYAEDRDRPDLDATSRMSQHLKYGEIHPRTMLRDLAEHPESGGEGARRLALELCWREFHADLLWHQPASAWHDLRGGLVAMAYDAGSDVDELVDAWRRGRTGFPFVDAGMRQLLAEGWMHNRLRMVTASFLVKDLHVWWPLGARHFLDHLLDGDLASNNQGWQWVAGTGTDAAPYFRVFNPVAQGKQFDPDGAYVRRWVTELGHLPGAAAHEPWRHADGYARRYPERIVDHDVERRESLRRYDQARKRST
jgi:deoxyribodipyrimidine photo-lyase